MTNIKNSAVQKAIEYLKIQSKKRGCDDDLLRCIETDKEIRIALNICAKEAKKQGYEKGTKQFAVEFMKSQEYADYMEDARQEGADQILNKIELKLEHWKANPIAEFERLRLEYKHFSKDKEVKQ